MTLTSEAAALLERLEIHGIRLGLETIRSLLSALGDPHRRFASVLVAGTNGKGSTAVLLAAMARAAGYRTGLYTSPHLEEVEERIRIDGRAVEGSAVSAALVEVSSAAQANLGRLPTYFEAVTAAALLCFARQQVDLAILEVGMGGRLDATNVCDPVLSLITEVGLEHREHLGSTLSAIAREKAGILRSGTPAILGTQRREVRTAISEAARRVGASILLAPETVTVEERSGASAPGNGWRVRTPTRTYDLATDLAGSHQGRNLSLAVLAAETLAQTGWERFDVGSIGEGARAARWPGRLEEVVLSDGRRVILDVAHNPDGADVLAAYLESRGEPYDLLFGALADKEVGRVLPQLAAGAERVVLTAPGSGRALAPEALVELAPAARTRVAPSSEEALTLALARRGRPLVVCGSVYLVGEIRVALRRRFGVPGPAVEVVC